MAETKQSTLTTYVGDMHALVSHGLQAIDAQTKALQGKDHPEALQAVQDFKQALSGHLTALEARVKALGGSATKPVKDAVAAVAGVAAGVINAVRPEQASKSIRDDYTFLSHTAVAYLMLYTTASGLGDTETAALAESSYRDCARMVMTIDRLMPTLVLQELRQDGLSVTDISTQVTTLIKDAWNREAKNTGMKA